MCTTSAMADIVILVDGSWSIGRLNFRLVRAFLENLVTAFDVGIDKTRIGMLCIVVFSFKLSRLRVAVCCGLFFISKVI